MMSTLLGVQLAVYAFLGDIPGSLTVLAPPTGVRAQIVTMKNDLMLQIAPIWFHQMGVIMPMSACPSGSKMSSNGIIQSLGNLNTFIIIFAWMLVPGGLIGGGVLYFYGWNEKWKKRGLKLAVGAVGLAALIILKGAIGNLITAITGGGCTSL